MIKIRIIEWFCNIQTQIKAFQKTDEKINIHRIYIIIKW